MSTRLAQFRAAQGHGADTKLAANEVIQRHTARYQISPSRSGVNGNIFLPIERLDGFNFNQCDVAAYPGRLGPKTDSMKISVSFNAPSRQGCHFLARFHRRRSLPCNVKQENISLEQVDLTQCSTCQSNKLPNSSILFLIWTLHLVLDAVREFLDLLGFLEYFNREHVLIRLVHILFQFASEL